MAADTILSSQRDAETRHYCATIAAQAAQAEMRKRGRVTRALGASGKTAVGVQSPLRKLRIALATGQFLMAVAGFSFWQQVYDRPCCVKFPSILNYTPRGALGLFAWTEAIDK